MNNKGFTLVEILSVIVLIGLLMGIGIPGISRISQNMKQKSLITKIKLVEEAGVFWGQDNKSVLQTDANCPTNDGNTACKKISIKELIEEDYLDSETYSDIVYNNPVDGNTMLNNCVYIYKKNNRVKANYSKDDASCIDEEVETPEDEDDEVEEEEEVDPPVTLFNCHDWTQESRYIEGSLACKIIESAVLAMEDDDAIRTVYDYEEESTNPAEKISKETEKFLKLTDDDYGSTSFYFRGNVIDNYVNFAGMCWRVVRTQSDGSVKLILEDKNTSCDSESFTGNWSIGEGNYGYATREDELGGAYALEENMSMMDYLNSSGYSDAMISAFSSFETNKLNGYSDKLKRENWCLGNSEELSYSDIINNYSAYYRLHENYTPSLECSGDFAKNMYVGTITGDEVAFSGGKLFSENNNYYLIKSGISNSFWTLTPIWFDGDSDGICIVYSNGVLTAANVTGWSEYPDPSPSFRPVIVIASSITSLKGDGTKNNPYVIN